MARLAPHDLSLAASWLRSARRVAVFTGAGISAESGVATFRDAGGVWERFPADEFGDLPGLLKVAATAPDRLVQYFVELLEPLAAATPNAGHLAVARLERYTQVSVITQNIDRLHQEAGSTIVYEVHGSMFRIVTLTGREIRTLSRQDLREIAERLRRIEEGYGRLPRFLAAVHPLLGVGLHGPYRPDVVMFGEAMAEPAWSRSVEAAASCDLMITMGTSGEVMPAAGLPHQASEHGARVIRVDPQPGFGDLWLPGPAASVLPALVAAAFDAGEKGG